MNWSLDLVNYIPNKEYWSAEFRKLHLRVPNVIQWAYNRFLF